MRKTKTLVHLGYIVAFVSIFFFSFLLTKAGPPQFVRPQSAAPDNGSLNDLSDIDIFLKEDRTSLQSVAGPLIVNNSGVLAIEIGTDSSLSVGSVPGTAVYGVAYDSSTSAGLYGYAEGPGAIGIVAEAGSPTAYAGELTGAVNIYGDAGGQLVSPFGANGKVYTPDESIGVMAIATDDQYVYTVGHDNVDDDGSAGWRIEKRDKITGAFDPAFQGGSVEETGVNGYGSDWYNIPNDIVLDDTFMYIVGFDANGADDQERLRIEKRRKSDGTLVTSFATNGYFLEPWISDQTYRSPGYAIALDADAIYIAGKGWRGSRVQKHFLNGNLDAGFDGDTCTSGESPLGCNCRFYQSTNSCNGPGGEYGAVSVHAYEAAYDLAIDDAQDVLYVLNRHTDGRTVIEKRKTVDGTLDTSFGGGGGLVISTWSNIHPWDIVLGPSKIYAYVLGYEDGTGNWHISKWRLDSGKLCDGTNGCVGEFGSSGVLTVSNSILSPYTYGGTFADKLGQSKLAVDSQGIYIAGGRTQKRGEWQIQKRDLVTGALITTFGVNGEIRDDEYGLDEPWTIYSDGGHLFIGGFTNNANDWRLEKRFKNVNSGDLTADGYVQAAQLNATSPFYTVPGFVSQNGIRIQGTPELGVYGSVDTGFGYGIYGYAPNNRGLVSIVSADNTGLISDSVYGVIGVADGYGDTGLYGYSVDGNGITAKVGSASVKYAAHGESSGITPGASYGVRGIGGYYGGYFAGEVYVEDDSVIDVNTVTIGDIELTETGLKELLMWCGADC